MRGKHAGATMMEDERREKDCGYSSTTHRKTPISDFSTFHKKIKREKKINNRRKSSEQL